MPPPLRSALLATAALAAAGALWWGAARLRAPSLAPSPEALVRGREVLAARCLHCHAAIPLAPRVRGWSAAHAYDAIGRLPTLQPAMPRFAGTDEDRRALAVYLAALGAGDVPPP